MPAKQANIIIFNPDQWRSDVMGHMGNPAAQTPHLDQIIQEDAVSFRNAFCQNPVCVPSRCSFMTGWYPHTGGHRTMAHMLHPDKPMLLRTLKEQGYYVWWGGKNDVIPGQNSYDDYCDVMYQPPNTAERPLFRNLHSWHEWRGQPDSDTYYSFYYGRIDKASDEDFLYDRDQGMIEGAIELIRNPPTDKPLCIYLPLSSPHPPYAVEDPYFSQIERDKLPPRIPAPENWDGLPSLLKAIYEGQHLQTWTEDRWDDLRATYYGMCSRVDAQFGLLVSALQEKNLYEDTAIFFFSDHGDFTGDYGLVEKTQNTFQDCLTNVPFVIKPPKSQPIKAGVRDALVELVDFSATVEALLGITPQHTHFGRSLLSVISGESDFHRDAVFCQGGRLADEDHAKELLGQLTPESLYYPRIITQQRSNQAHSKGTMIRTQTHKYVYRLNDQDELYDLRDDPEELHNRVDDAALGEIKQELKNRLLRFLMETSDVVPHQADQR